MDEKIINKFVDYCLKLIENKKLREKIRQNNLKEIREGRFSIKERNKKLKKIYQEAIKK